jgi:hypothetical protein
MTPDVQELLDSATPLTKVVDNYMLERIGHTRLFFEIYFAHGKRTIQVADGPKLSAYKCTCGCVHPQGNEWYPIAPKQNSQSIYDHLCTRKHVGNCQPDGVESVIGLNDYVAHIKKVVPRSDRWDRDKNKESRSKSCKPRRISGSRKKTKLAQDDPTVVALFADEHSIASHCLNSLSPLGPVMSQGQQAQLTQQLQQKPTRTH